jgi:hypothetical protein
MREACAAGRLGAYPWIVRRRGSTHSYMSLNGLCVGMLVLVMEIVKRFGATA